MQCFEYCDPGYIEGSEKWSEFVSAIERCKRVILTNDKPIAAPSEKAGVTFERLGYIAVFAVDDVIVDDSGLKFRLSERICDLI
ncbi:hypothetical protein B2G71_07355 [Novosphingobium sp. PC22D]|nr:hypothetical protein B2G71_07355 [Novosphingobium sp. PC22D]